jgi:Sec7-like guanine-nucleotide exchange factor
MLNTDQHSSKVVKRMTKEDFIKNNRGINDNADLPDEYLIGIYDEIGKRRLCSRVSERLLLRMAFLNKQVALPLAWASSGNCWP